MANSASPATLLTSIDDISIGNYLADGLTNGQTYFVRMRAVDVNANFSDYTADVSAMPLPPLDLQHYVLQHPLLNDYMTFYAQANIEVSSIDSASVEAPNNMIDLDYQALGDHGLFKADVKLNGAGQYDLFVKATGINDTEATIEQSYQVIDIDPHAAKVLTINDQSAHLEVPNGAVSQSSYVLAHKEQSETETIFHFNSFADFKLPARISISLDPNIQDIGKYFVYQNDGGDWIELPTQVYQRNGKTEAVVFTKNLGEFKIAYNHSFYGSNLVPNVYSLAQNYPNPFNPSTTIQYNLANDGFVSISIYNILGQRIRDLLTGHQLAGARKTVVWDGKDRHGNSVASGIYIYRIQSSHFSESKRLLLIK